MIKQFPTSQLRPRKYSKDEENPILQNKKARKEKGIKELEPISESLTLPVLSLYNSIPSLLPFSFEYIPINFFKLVTDIQKLLLQWSWTEKDHINLVRVCKKFRNIIYNKDFFKDIPVPKYFPGPLVFKIWYNYITKVPRETFIYTFDIITKEKVDIEQKAVRNISKLCDYEGNDKDILRLFIQLAFAGDNKYEDFIVFVSKYLHLFPKYIKWIIVAFDTYWWTFNSLWTNGNCVYPEELVKPIEESFFKWLQGRAIENRFYFNRVTLKLVILNWERVDPIIGNSDLVYFKYVDAEDLQKFVKLVLMEASDEKILKRLRAVPQKYISNDIVDRLLTIIETNNINYRQVKWVFNFLNYREEFRTRAHNILLSKYTAEALGKQIEVSNEFRLERASALSHILPRYMDNASEEYLLAVLDHKLWKVNHTNRESIGRLLIIAIRNKYWNVINKFFRNLGTATFCVDNMPDSLYKLEFMAKYQNRITYTPTRIDPLQVERYLFFHPEYNTFFLPIYKRLFAGIPIPDITIAPVPVMIPNKTLYDNNALEIAEKWVVFNRIRPKLLGN
jgi:hypothetical protein